MVESGNGNGPEAAVYLYLGLSVASTIVGVINKNLPSATLCITADRVAWIIVSNSTVVHTKMGDVSKTTPLLGVIFHRFGKT